MLSEPELGVRYYQKNDRFAAWRQINDHIAPNEITDDDLQFLENVTLNQSETIIWRGEVSDEEQLQSDLLQGDISLTLPARCFTFLKRCGRLRCNTC